MNSGCAADGGPVRTVVLSVMVAAFPVGARLSRAGRNGPVVKGVPGMSAPTGPPVAAGLADGISSQ
jgi:hypothetical protein